MADRGSSDPEPSVFNPIVEQRSVWISLKNQLAAKLRPQQLPPLELESKAVPVKDIWSHEMKRAAVSRATSFAVHTLIIAALIFLALQGPAPPVVGKPFRPEVFKLVSYQPPMIVAHNRAGGGGGGGRDLRPASHGSYTKFTVQPLASPVARIVNRDPALPVAPSLLMPTDVHITQPELKLIGDPKSLETIASNGPGSQSGIGSGKGGGIGPGDGPGAGGGKGGGCCGGDQHDMGSISAPRVIYAPDPEYSEAARKSKYQGTVVLWVMIGADGRVHSIQLRQPVGLGLDEKAIEAVKTWRFEPARRSDGKPIEVASMIEVNFRLF